MRSDNRKLLFIIYSCVAILIVYILISSNWKSINTYKYNNLYSLSRIVTFQRQPIKTVTINPAEYSTTDKAIDTENNNNKENQIIDNRKYRINTTGCKIPELSLYDEETKNLFKHTNKTQTIWECVPNMVRFVRYNETSVHLNWDGQTDEYRPLCYYRSLEIELRGDKTFRYGPFIGPFNDDLHLPDYEFVHIICYDNSLSANDRKVDKNFNSSATDLIHNEIIPLIPYVNKTSDSNVPNVLLLAIDATSYLNFKRHFLRTEKFLKKQNFFELRAYNKVGHNTFPNMIPFLTGHNPYDFVTKAKLKRIYFDNWPLIWKKYSNKGFITAFLEEMSNLGLFHFNLLGFKQKPTDYQTRPFHMEISGEKYNYYCYLDKTETEHSLIWTYDFIRAMNKREQKYFAYISISEMTHDWIEAGHYMDVPYYELLTKLFDEKLMENTAIFLFSDHGYRFGKLRQTHSGEVENRLPFMYIHLPNNTEQRYLDNLRQNQFRLTTHYDIHATLTHLIDGKPDPSLPHGISLIDTVISDERNCKSAAIPDMYCSCYQYIQVYNMDAINPETTVLKIVNKINSFTAEYREECSEYEFESIHKLYNRSLDRNDHEFKLGNSLIYLIQVFVNPGMALFETVIRGFDKNTRFDVVGDITRINLYGNQSHCLNNKLLKNYCYCNDLKVQ